MFRDDVREDWSELFKFKMADEKGNVVGLSDQNTAIASPFKADFDVVNDMKVPETITVQNMQGLSENRPTYQGNQMTVPDKIVLNGGVESETQTNPNFGLQNAGVNLDNYMGGMVTPPRTLTVDDTSSRYMERKVDDGENRRKELDRYELCGIYMESCCFLQYLYIVG
jgi:hypothetical protein